ncbi:1-aminocyclopropane-1-carboxylate oxidase homolog 4-like [Tasmannia lanceolata]|uniref:1-aminocyclopropane-1-carboxylate oxidase homolog 4-like n=1 Tax=Tasmannia lanceolata TaxID=3420 RepID=UPI004063FA37
MILSYKLSSLPLSLDHTKEKQTPPAILSRSYSHLRPSLDPHRSSRFWQRKLNPFSVLSMGSDQKITSQDYDRVKEVKEFDESKIGVKGLVESGTTTIPRFFIHPPENLTSLKPAPPTFQIPVVDLSGINSDRRSETVEQIRDASRKWGFFQVTNHGIPVSVLNETISAFKAFNEQPLDVLAQHYGRQVGTGVNYNTNFDLLQSKAATWRDTLQLRTGPELAEWNQIPAICRKELVEWDQKAKGLAEVLMGLLCEGLDVGPGRLKELTFLEGRVMAAHYYPECPQPDLTLGLGPHSDPGVLTVVLQNQVGGLQVKYEEEWVEVKPLPGGVVINIGDFLQIISNEEYKSAVHRVVANASHVPRVSIAIFFNPGKRGDSDFYGPMPELISPEKPALYRNFTVTEYMTKFSSRALGGKTLINHFKL